jgi:hypothetical protein
MLINPPSLFLAWRWRLLISINPLSFPDSGFLEGIKYMGFQLKPNDYQKVDWRWLLEKLKND